MSMPETKARIYRFDTLVALGFPSTKQLYLTPADAKALAKELTRFANNIETSREWIATRNVENGIATTESTGKRAVKMV